MASQNEVNAKLTPAAEKFIRRMMRFATDPNSGFRLKVRPGGCSGMAVEFDLVTKPGDDELIWDPAGLRIFLDSTSSLLLSGAIVDFVDRRAVTGFVVTKPGETAQWCSPASQMVSVASIVRH